MGYNSTRLSIYALKRQFPLAVDVYSPGVSSTNFDTGKITQAVTKYHVDKSILLPDKVKRTGTWPRSLVQREANEFQNGQYYDISSRTILIDVKDLPRGFALDLNCWVVFNHERYEIRTVETHEVLNAYVLVLQKLKGAQTNEIIDVFVREIVHFTDESTGG